MSGRQTSLGYLLAGAMVLLSCVHISSADVGVQDLVVNIGGQYRIMGNSGTLSWHPQTIASDADTSSFLNQRFRTWFDVKAGDNVGGYLQVEMGHVMWGQDDEFPKTYSVGGDEVGVELRRGYLTYTDENIGIFKAGIQDWNDSFGDVLASSDHDFNVGGLSVVGKSESLGNAEIKLGGFIIRDDNAVLRDEATLLALDTTWSIGEGGSFGLSAYYLDDKGGYSYGTFGGPADSNGVSGSDDLWVGVRGLLPLGEASLGGFVIYNTGGTESPDWDHSGFAAGIKTSCNPGKAKVGFQALYSTGDDGSTANDSDEFRTIAQSDRDNFGAFGYWSFLGLTSPRGSSDVQDLGVNLQNRGLGLMTIQSNVEFPVTDSLTGYLAGGWLSSAEDNPVSGSSDMGVELLAEVRLDLGSGLALELGGAYLLTGDFYAVSATDDPDDLYELFSRFQLEF